MELKRLNKYKNWKKKGIIPEIPVIACTAYGAKEQISECLEVGMVDYLIKPVTN